MFMPTQPSAATSDDVLAVGQRLHLRGSGDFAVGDKVRRLAEVPVTVWRTGMGEYVAAARIRSFLVLGVVGIPWSEEGWWYDFFSGGDLREVMPGELSFGLRTRSAIRLTIEGPEGRRVLFLSGDSGELALLLTDMQGLAERHERADRFDRRLDG
jgi:hypothetical protein